MVAELEYDFLVRRLIPATVAVLAVGLLVLVLVPKTQAQIQAQINGVPASVTSMGFGGHFSSAPGVPASVTSLGFGSQVNSPFFNEPVCCINPLFPLNPNPPLFTHLHHHHLPFFPVAIPVYPVPYSPVFVAQPGVDDSMDEEDYTGGPTIFDRRGSGEFRHADEGRYSQRAHRDERQIEATSEPDAPAATTPVANQPETVLVFKDGHQVEVQNYAVIGSTLYDLTPGHRHKIALAELNLSATAKQNDDRGIDFQLPAGSETN
jgi:hypothetical protein